MTETATETSMRQGLASLAAEVAPRPPSLDELARRAETDSRPEGPSSRRKRTVAGLVVAGAVVIGTTGAAALGVVPGPVRDAFDTFRGHSDAYVLDPDEAELVRSAVGEDGRTVEYWIAPIDGGGTCEYVRYVEADGTNHQDGWSACSPDGNQLSLSPGLFVVASPSGDDQGVAGRAPEGTVAVRVRFDSGEADVSVDDDRYFIASFERTEHIHSVEAVDADGVVIDMTSYPAD
jgi:hypothetical protein